MLSLFFLESINCSSFSTRTESKAGRSRWKNFLVVRVDKPRVQTKKGIWYVRMAFPSPKFVLKQPLNKLENQYGEWAVLAPFHWLFKMLPILKYLCLLAWQSGYSRFSRNATLFFRQLEPSHWPSLVSTVSCLPLL